MNVDRALLLRLAGAMAIVTAGYHSFSGSQIISEISLSADDRSFVSGTYQLGSMGWVAGGVLLIAAAGMVDHAVRWIVGVSAALYGLPAVGTLALNEGRPNIGGAMLAVVVLLAVLALRQPNSSSTEGCRAEVPTSY